MRDNWGQDHPHDRGVAQQFVEAWSTGAGRPFALVESHGGIIAETKSCRA
jgi:hypothetical protein